MMEKIYRNEKKSVDHLTSARMDWNVKIANTKSITCSNNFLPEFCLNFAKVAADRKLGV